MFVVVGEGRGRADTVGDRGEITCCVTELANSRFQRLAGGGGGEDGQAGDAVVGGVDADAVSAGVGDFGGLAGAGVVEGDSVVVVVGDLGDRIGAECGFGPVRHGRSEYVGEFAVWVVD
ncbi:hypothetical protein ACFQ9R_12865 [Nocardia sp. NPDC056541]|uniref:hypothetical protein n=1 Tax=Nocardia sp. NPDC056541 TaxID=3345860 RepID=UPI00366E7F69